VGRFPRHAASYEGGSVMGRRWFWFGLTIWVTAFSAHARAQGTLEGANANVSAAALPVVHEAIRVQIDQQAAHVEIEQHFKNESTEQLEGRYLFRIGEGARVSGLSYWNGEEEIVGEVFERKVATEVYQEVTGIGRDPALFEQVGEGTFSFRIFPLEPGEIKRVRVRYDVWLAAHGDRVELRIPVSGQDTQARAEIRDPRGLGELSSPSHVFTRRQISESHLTLTTERPQGKPTAFLLRYRIGAQPFTLSSALHRDAGHDAYAMLQLATPELATSADTVAKDVTIVIDHSGSMSGEPLTHACAAAKQIVSSLDARDRANLVVFDDRAEALYKQPKQLTNEVREELTRRIERLASGGGTDIGLALKTTLEAQNRDALPNIVLFMTDGQSDAKAALEIAHADKSDTRIFTIGLGAGVEKALLSRLAADKRGRFVFIADVATIEPTVARLYRQIAAPLLTDLRIEVEGAPVMDVYPRTLRDLFVDDELRVLARLMPKEHGDTDLTVRLHAKLRGKPVTFETKTVSPESLKRRWVGMAWAQARVDDLLEEVALHGETEELKNEVIDLALAYNFVTPYTSLLAVPASELTDAAKDMIDTAREAKRRLRDAHPDAAALSRTDMPPGDPVISVRAPAHARQVSARFPFGLTLDLVWDPMTERWMSRFLVPKSVSDGVYLVDVWIVHADGSIEHASLPYRIDSAQTEAKLDVRAVPGGLLVRVLTDEEPREVRAALVLDPSVRVLLEPGDTGGCAFGFLPAEPGKHQVRVVVADAARNERVMEQVIEVPAEQTVWSESEAEVCR